jgi:uncharacterized protein DUF955
MLSDAELVAERVLAALEIKRVPVDVFDIANRERIELCPTTGDEDFFGRLEFHPSVNRFLLFYPASYPHDNGRLRYSIAHELGHYYLSHHQESLRKGNAHSSEPGFICQKELEREADEFAAGLLIPKPELDRRLSTRSFMTLREITALATDCQSSVESAAIRYAKFTTDRCVVVVSRFGKIHYSVASDEGRRFWRSPAFGTPVPPGSLSAAPPLQIQDGKEGDILAWSPSSFFRGEVWEEAMRMGYGTTVTLLALQAKSSR